jgi:hypothetical protein
MYFYLVWSNEEDERKFEQLADQARDEWTSQNEYLKPSTLPNKQQETKRKPVIEEIQ